MQTVNFVKNALLIFEKRLYFRVNDNIPTDGSWVLRDKLRFMREIYEPVALKRKNRERYGSRADLCFFLFSFPDSAMRKWRIGTIINQMCW